MQPALERSRRWLPASGSALRHRARLREKVVKSGVSSGRKEKGPLENERPKSREETPKEGSETSDAIASLANLM
jgi:hypothetical protein